MSQDDAQVDTSLGAMQLKLEETIYNSILNNNGSLVFADSSQTHTWHEVNVPSSEIRERKIRSAGEKSDDVCMYTC